MLLFTAGRQVQAEFHLAYRVHDRLTLNSLHFWASRHNQSKSSPQWWAHSTRECCMKLLWLGHDQQSVVSIV